MKKSPVYIAIILVIILCGIWFWSGYKSSDDLALQDIQKTANSTSTPNVVDNQVQNASPITDKVNSIDNKKIMNATLHTNKGDITIEFNPKLTPNTVANFIKLAQSNFYDGVKFHRVIKGFMIQGGDPLTKDDSKASMWGTGGPGYAFNDELTSDNKNNTGTIAMANSGPNTNGSQFFINVKDNNFLDTKHTVFGHVTKGMDVVTAIENTPTGHADRPIEAVIIKSITLQ